MDCGLEKREVDRATLAPRGEHRVDAVVRGRGRDADLERDVREVGGDAIDPEQTACVGGAARDRRDVVDRDVELRRERVMDERDAAPRQRAQQVRGRARRKVLATERRPADRRPS